MILIMHTCCDHTQADAETHTESMVKGVVAPMKLLIMNIMKIVKIIVFTVSILDIMD